MGAAGYTKVGTDELQNELPGWREEPILPVTQTYALPGREGITPR